MILPVSARCSKRASSARTKVFPGWPVRSGVIGAQYGARVGQRLRGEQLRALLAALVLLVALRLGYALFIVPDELYTIAKGVVA